MENTNSYPILITGAANGIGYATALKLCSMGFKVVALSRNVAGLEKLQEAAGESCQTMIFDLLNDDPEKLPLLLTALNIHGLRGIIHNAGLLVNKPFEQVTAQDLRDSYETNVLAPYRFTQAMLPFLKAAAPSHVVHISSMGGIQGTVKFPGLSAYSSSKGALCVLTESLALELAPSKIAVNCLALGAVQTEMLSAAFPGYNAPMQPTDMASMVAWFVTEGDRFFNGKILPVATSTP